MANPEHLDILKQGMEVWNRWREEHPLSYIDLCDTRFNNANFSDTDLRRVNFSLSIFINTVFAGTDLTEAILNNADLAFANLASTDLIGAVLRNANLSNTDLSFANLRHADLSYADLSYADLRQTNLDSANISNINLSNATIGWTSFGDQDLRTIKGLTTIKHIGPSPLSINTIYQSAGDIPEVFVRGTGASDSFIEYIHALANKPIQYYTCFISYSSKDQTFAERLYADLQTKGVRCWYAPEDLKIGDKFWHRIDESIRLYDKLLVVLSKTQ